MIKTYLERDIPQLWINVSTIKLQRFLQMIAHINWQLLNINLISKSLWISTTAANHYLDILEETFFIRRLTPLISNIKKRLVKSPKIYIRDSWILHNILNIQTKDDLLNSQLIWNSWEWFVIEQINSNLPKKYDLSFFRTSAWAELDLVLSVSGVPEIAIEIKQTPKITKWFWNALEDTKCKKAFIIHAWDDSYPIKENVWAISIREIWKIFK